jgi:hypothetical protein
MISFHQEPGPSSSQDVMMLQKTVSGMSPKRLKLDVKNKAKSSAAQEKKVKKSKVPPKKEGVRKSLRFNADN